MLFADGAVELVVERIDGPDVHCRVIAGGRLFSNKGLNLPGRRLSVATLTEKDRRDLEYLSHADVDIVAVPESPYYGYIYVEDRPVLVDRGSRQILWTR